MKHKQEQCLKCNFEKTCNGLSFNERNFPDCDVIEIETYKKLLVIKKNDLQAKVRTAFVGDNDQMKTIQSQLNKMIEADPRVSLEILIDKIKRDLFNKHISTIARRQDLAFDPIDFCRPMLTLRPMVAIHPMSATTYRLICPVPRLCRLFRETLTSGWGFTLYGSYGPPYIGNVDCDSPAEKAGIKKGDEILAINSVSVAGLTHIRIVERVRGLHTLFLDLLVK